MVNLEKNLRSTPYLLNVVHVDTSINIKKQNDYLFIYTRDAFLNILTMHKLFEFFCFQVFLISFACSSYGNEDMYIYKHLLV